MPTLKLTYKRVPADTTKYGEGFSLNSLPKAEFESFNHSLLGLGDLSPDGKYIQTLAAFFDLEGFTAFCSQEDSHLIIPEFLTRYLEWLFKVIRDSAKEGETDSLVRIFGSLPFFAKFLGDGVLFLWDTEYSGKFRGICNISANLKNITHAYVKDFLPEIRKHTTKPPERLRCGVARGQIVSIGSGSDYVGPCVNRASRLHKISTLSFAISRIGFDLTKTPTHPLNKTLTLKKTAIAGLGLQELIYVDKQEFKALTDDQKILFADP